MAKKRKTTHYKSKYLGLIKIRSKRILSEQNARRKVQKEDTHGKKT